MLSIFFMPLTAKIMKQTIKNLLLFVTDALKYEFKLHQRSGI